MYGLSYGFGESVEDLSPTPFPPRGVGPRGLLYMELYSLAGSDVNSERQDDANEEEGEEREGDALSSGQAARSNAGVGISIRGIILRDSVPQHGEPPPRRFDSVDIYALLVLYRQLYLSCSICCPHTSMISPIRSTTTSVPTCPE